jgi:uncharacterized membrane protein
METPHAEAPAPRGASSGPVTAVIGLTVAVVAIIFLFNTSPFPSSWYWLFKLVHVVGAVVWVGGGVMLTILAIRAERSNDPLDTARIAKQAAFVGQRVFAPVSLLVLLMGIAMVINLHWGWGTTWITIGLVGFLISFLTGLLVLGPQAKRIGELSDSKGAEAPETQAAIQKLLLLARVDMGVLLLVVADMVLKPFT